MAENMPSNTVPKAMVVRNEFFSEGMAKPDTGTVPPTFRQAAEGDSHRISGRCEENKDNENLSDTSDAAAENSQTIDIGPGEFDTYAIAYTYKEQSIRMKKAVEETKNNTETSTFKANDSNMHTQARDPNPMNTQNMNPQPMDAENDVNPNPMYLQNTMEPNASPGPARNPNPMYTHNATNPQPTYSENDINPNPMYLQSTMEPNASLGPARNPNPMYTHNATDTYPTYSENDVNPNPMYLQSTMEPNASPGPARNPNPMYTHNATDTYPTHSRNDVNPNPMYLQSTMEPNASPGPARNPNPMYTHNATNPQPTYSENDINPNPMYLQSTMEPNASPGPARNPNPMYTHNATNPQPTYSENDINPNPMYLQSTMEPNASPGPSRNPNPMYTHNATNTSPTHSRSDVNPNPMYLQSTMEPNASPGPSRNPNPMYTHNATNTSPTHSRSDVNPNPMYPQSIPGPTFKSNKSDDNPCTQTSADTHQQAFSRPATNNGSEDTQASLSSQNQPAAASNNINDANDVLHALDPNPMYAAAYTCQSDLERNTASEDTQASLSSQNQPAAASNNINDANDVLHALDPNPMYAAAYTCQSDLERNTASEDTQASLSSQNQPAAASNNISDANDVLHALNPNRMYVPNVQHPAAHGCTRRRVIFAVEAAVVLGGFIVAGVFLSLSLSARPPQLPAVSNTPHHKGGDVKQERITFGGEGEEPGKFRENKGTAVSADNEIFVTDALNNRVHVFSIDGTFLRLFPTVVPGESTRMLEPHGVASDVESGYLWVLGKSSRSNEGHVVQYSKNGQPIKKFDVSLKSFYPVIAMDVRNNKVIVGDQTTITMFDPNGSRLWSSEVRTGYGIFGVTSDKEGNVLLTDGRKTIQKYNPSGVKIFEFGTSRKGNSPRGICLDTSGHIIVANYLKDRVDMFTSQGEFVRTIADIKFPEAVAMGPCGELVVTSPYKNTVSIFPRHMVLP
ncbi:hypothetical protein Bbelb_384680 [Branchiostoma belcheri]|nr:hypothetical protein Bbelb_384680 [Branchiostoma belcheri]